MALRESPAPKRALKPKYPLWLCISIFITLAAMVISLLSVFIMNQWVMDISLNGENAVTLEYGDKYEEEGASARFHGSRFFKKGWEVTPTVKGKVDDETLGEYTVTYQASKLFCHSQAQRIVTVQDTIPPEITLVADPESFTLPGTQYVEEGFAAVDNYDGDLTDKVERTETEDKVTYTVTDSSGNVTTVERTIYYHDPAAPVLTLKGDKEITINAGDSFSEPGWTAIDNVDGDVTDRVEVSGSVDTYTAGTYTLKYTVTDKAGNKAKAKRIVVVEALRQTDTVSPGSKVIYLTFDDGPGPYTRGLLDTLAKYNVKVTFFTCNTGYDSMIKAEAEEGHSIAIHSATHDYAKIYASKEAYFKDLQKQSDIIYNAAGIRTTLVRFPGGSSNTVSRKYCSGIMTTLSKSLTDQGYQFFDWNVNSGDADTAKNSDDVYNNVINGIQAKQPEAAVVLQHDIHKFSVEAVERIIIWGLNNGYTFLPLDASSPTAHQHIAN